MEHVLEELDYQQTPLGDISLRRRSEPKLNGEILYEVKLGDEFLMSSLFTEAEIQLATLALATQHSQQLDVVVGGLGLGYTAAAVLKNPDVASLAVIEIMAPVIDWHQSGLVPLGEELVSNPKCSLLHGDFFELATGAGSFDTQDRINQVDVVLLDIDHSPSHWLSPGNRTFYTSHGLQCLKAKILPGGVFGMWSNDPPDSEFNALLESVFGSASAHIVRFSNPYTDSESSNTVYLALVQ